MWSVPALLYHNDHVGRPHMNCRGPQPHPSTQSVRNYAAHDDTVASVRLATKPSGLTLKTRVYAPAAPLLSIALTHVEHRVPLMHILDSRGSNASVQMPRTPPANDDALCGFRNALCTRANPLIHHTGRLTIPCS